MDKADLAALLAAHGGRAQPVASLHVLRSPSLGPHEHAFLVEHHEHLATVDLSRWLALATPAQRPAVVDALQSLAARDPGRFEHEIARAPYFHLEQSERALLIERLQGSAPESLVAALSGEVAGRGAKSAGEEGGAGVVAPSGEMFDPSDLLGDLDLDIGDRGPHAASSGGAPATAESEPRAEEGLGDLADLLGDGDLADLLGGGGDLSGETGGPFGVSFGGGAGSHARTPALDALLSELSSARTPREKAAWKRRAAALGADSSEDWSTEVTRLPEALAAAVDERAASSPRSEERAALLEWLLQKGAKRARVVELALDLFDATQAAEAVRQWLAQSFLPRLFADKNAWSKHGVVMLSSLVSRRGFGELTELLTAVVSGAGVLGPGLVTLPSADGGAALRAAIFGALAAMSLERAAESMSAGQGRAALGYAAALSSLGVPSRSGQALSALGRKRAARGHMSRLLSLAPRRRPRDVPSLEDFITAVHILASSLE